MQYAALLVKELGIYPPGSYVRIRNGDVVWSPTAAPMPAPPG